MRIKLKCHRLAAGFTIEEIANEIGVIALTYRNYEYGLYTPRKKALLISKLLHCSVDDVLEDVPRQQIPEDLRLSVRNAEKLLKKMKKNNAERVNIQMQFAESIAIIKKAKMGVVKMNIKKTKNFMNISNKKILAALAVSVVAVSAGADAGALAGYFTDSLNTIVSAVRVVGGVAGLIAGSLFFMTLMNGSGGSLTGQAFKLVIAIGGVLTWSTGAASAIFTNLVTSGLCF